MPLNLDGWVTPEDEVKGLYKVSNTLQENNQLKERKSERDAAKRLATNQFIESTYDPKDLFTGTLEDPNLISGLMDLKNSAYDLASKGVTPDLIKMSLSGKAAKLSVYSEKAKVLGRQWKEVEPFLKTQKGIDLSKAKTAYENMAFRNEDGSIKDPSEIDHQKNYIDEVLRTQPVYNNEGITDFVANSGKDTRVNKITRINSKGGSYSTDAELTAPNWAIPEKNDKGVTIGFEPKFEYATGDGEQLMHDFNGTKAPVKMVTDEVFQSLKSNAKAYILQEARHYAKEHGVDVSSPEVENFAKAVAYDELKNAAKTSTSIKDIIKTKENPAPHISVRVNTGKGDVPVIDVYSSILKKANEHVNSFIRSKSTGAKIMGAVPFNILDDNEQEVIMKKAKNSLGNDTTAEDIYVNKIGGELWIMNAEDDKAVARVSKTGANLSANQSLGVKSKQKSVNESQNSSTKKKIDW